jgi:nucleotide-binding universal stress UspA family protein
VNTILVGVDNSEHSKDAIALASRIGRVSSGPVVVACGFRGDQRGGTANAASERDAEQIARALSRRLEGIHPGRIQIRAVRAQSADHGLGETATSEAAAIVVVGSSRPIPFAGTVRSGVGASLLQNAGFAVGVAPDGYRGRSDAPIGRIGVAYDGYAESRAALVAAIAAARAFGAELEVITVLSAQILAAPRTMPGPGYFDAEEESARDAREALDAILARLPPELTVQSTVLDGRPAHQLILRSRHLDLLVAGSRGFNPLPAVRAGGVSEQILRDSHCPVIAVPSRTRSLFGKRQPDDPDGDKADRNKTAYSG